MMDEDTGVEARIVTERQDDGTTGVVDVQIRATGRALTSEDLLILGRLGLALPTRPDAVPGVQRNGGGPAVSAPAAHPATGGGPVSAPAARKTTPAKAAPTKTSGRSKGGRPAKSVPPAQSAKGRQYRQSPSDEALLQLMTTHGGPTAVANALGVPLHTVAGWVRRARVRGAVFSTDSAEPTSVAAGGSTT